MEQTWFSRRHIVTSVLVLMLSIPAWPESNLTRLATEYAITAEKLKPHTDGFLLDNDPSSVDLLERKWQISAEWIATWLDAHPTATENQVEAAFPNLDHDGSVSVVLLSSLTYLVAIQDGEMGTIFIIAADAPSQQLSYRVRWTIRDPQPTYAKELYSWTALRAGSCPRRDEENCGPLFGSPVRLPDTAEGHARFYVDGQYAQSAGGTVGNQMSIWEWDGKVSRPLLVKKYVTMIDQTQGTELKGDVLHIGEKSFFRSFFGCGSCEERQLDWSVRITPNGIQDLGERSLVPEMDALDEVVDKLSHGKSASDSASEQVIDFLNEIIADQKQVISTWSKNEDYFSLGMLSQSTVTREGSETFLNFATDDVGPLRFRMQPSNDGFFLREVKDLSEEEKQNPSSPTQPEQNDAAKDRWPT